MTPNDTSRWRELCKELNQPAFEEIFEETKNLVYTICFRKLKNTEDARDAFQQTYTRFLFLVKDSTPESGIEDIEGLIKKIAAREADNLRMRRNRRNDREFTTDTLPEVSDEKTPDKEAADQEVRIKTLQLVEQHLPEEYHLPLILHYFDGLSYQSIASILSVPKSTIAYRINKGLKKLHAPFKKAGMGETLSVLTAIATSGSLLSPPSTCNASEILSYAHSAIKAGDLSSVPLSSYTAGTAATAGKGFAVIAASIAVVALITTGLLAKNMISSNEGKKTTITEAQTLPPAKDPIEVGQESETLEEADAVQVASKDSLNKETEANSPIAVSTSTNNKEAQPLSYRVSVVWEESQSPVSGAAVQFFDIPESFTTGDEGVASLDVMRPVGSGTIVINHPDALTKTISVVPDNYNYQVELQKGAVISGKLIIQATGTIAPGMDVYLREPGCCCGGGPEIARVQTDEEGHFKFTNLKPGEVWLFAHQDQFLSDVTELADDSITIQAGEEYGSYNILLTEGARLSGTVTSKETGEPIEGARVVVKSGKRLHEDYTNEDGHYQLVGMPEGRMEITVEADNLVKRYVFTEVRFDEEGSLNIRMDDGVDAKILIVDESGNPVEGAKVYRDSHYYMETVRLSGENPGEYIVKGVSANGETRINVYADGYKRVHGQPLEIEGEMTTITLEANPVQVGYYSGNVVSEDGKPLPGMTVAYGSMNNKVEVMTDHEGHYFIEAHDIRHHNSLTVYGKDYAPAGVKLEPGTFNEPATKDFVLSPGREVDIIVTDEEGNGVEGLFVGMRMEIGRVGNSVIPGHGISAGRTDANGRIYIRALPTEPIELDIYGRGYSRIDFPEFTREGLVEVTIEPSGIIQGQLLGADGLPVEEYVLRVMGNGIDSSRVEPGEVIVDDQGVFILDELNVGKDYDLTFLVDDEVVLVKPDLIAERIETATLHEFNLDAIGSTIIQVVDASTGQAIEGAHVMYFWGSSAGSPPFIDWDRLERKETYASSSMLYQTNSEGEITLGATVPASWVYTIVDGYQRFYSSLLLLEKKDGKVIIPLKEEFILRGKVPEALIENGREMSISLQNPRGTPYQSFRNVKLEPDGSFSFHNLEKGQYMLGLYKHKGYVSFSQVWKNIEDLENQETVIDFGSDLGSNVLSGLVLDNEKPLAGASISLTSLSGSDYHFSDLAEDDGSYNIEYLPAGKYRVQISTPHRSGSARQTTKEIVDIDSSMTLDFDLAKSPRVYGKVIYTSGAKEQKPYHVQLFAASPQRVEDNSEQTVAGQVGDDGKFSISETLKGEYSIRISAQLGTYTVPGNVNITMGEKGFDLGELNYPRLVERKALFTYEGEKRPKNVFLQSIDRQEGKLTSHLKLENQLEDSIFTLEGAVEFDARAAGFVVEVDAEAGGHTSGDTHLLFHFTPDGQVSGIIVENKNANPQAVEKLAKAKSVTIEGEGIKRVLHSRDDENDSIAQIFDISYESEDYFNGSKFAFFNLPEGEYQLTIMNKDTGPIQKEVTVIPGEYNNVIINVAADS